MSYSRKPAMKLILKNLVPLLMVLYSCTSAAIQVSDWSQSSGSVSSIAHHLALAESLKEQGKLPLALDVLHTEKQQLAIGSQEHTLVMGLIANVHILQRRYDEAFLVLRDTQPRAEQQGWTLLAADQAGYLANLFQRQQNPERALRWYQKSLKLSLQSGDKKLQLQNQINIARVHIKRSLHNPGDTTKATNLVNDIIASVEEGSEKLAESQLDAAQLFLDYLPLAGAKSQAIKGTTFKSLTGLLSQTDGLSQRRTSQAYGLLAELYQTENRYQEAIPLLEKAIFSAQQYPDLLYKWEWHLGTAYKRTGNTKQAYHAMERAVYNVEAIRQDIPVDYVDGRSSFRQTLEPLYLDLTDLLLIQARNSSEPKARQNYLRQARATMELLKRSELEDYFDNRCVIESQQATDLGQLSDSTAAIYPIMFPDRLELLVSFAQHIEQRTVPITSATISNAATQLASHFRSLNPAWQSRSADFYSWLVSPIQDLLVANQIDTLIYLPDGALRLVPIASLYSGQQFLIEQYSVVTSPGLTLFDTTETSKNDLNILMAGLSMPGPVVDDVSERLYAAINVATDADLQKRLDSQKNLSTRLAYPRERRKQVRVSEADLVPQIQDMANTPGQLRIVSKRTADGIAVEIPDDLRLISKRPGLKPERPGFLQVKDDLKRKLRIINKIALAPNERSNNSETPLRIVAKHDSKQSLLLARAKQADARQENTSDELFARGLRIVAKTPVQNSDLMVITSAPQETVQMPVSIGLTDQSSGPLRITRRSMPKDETILALIKQNRVTRLKQRLKLPGVDREIANISDLYDGEVLVNENFGKAEFIHELLHNRYDIIHIASHGVFGDSAQNSFVMTHDELLDMDQLEVLLNHEKFEKAPVELITLSACQTADGDDRAPLGISGIALRAKVRSALGALWAVSDAATVELMSEFYKNLQKPGMTKAQALREAQISLLQNEQYRHPFFWSAFILIGNWL